MLSKIITVCSSQTNIYAISFLSQISQAFINFQVNLFIFIIQFRRSCPQRYKVQQNENFQFPRLATGKRLERKVCLIYIYKNSICKFIYLVSQFIINKAMFHFYTDVY